MTNELVAEIARSVSLVKARDALASALGRQPTEHEWADAVGLPLPDMYDVMRTAQFSKSALVDKHYPLVVSVAKRYDGQGAQFQDCMQEGTLGCVRCARTRLCVYAGQIRFCSRVSD